ncbi:MAG: hypothetical protein ACLFRX_08070 [Gemmatimonadota bacterium]
MTLQELLETRRDQIVEEATASLDRRRLPHYRSSGGERNRNRLERLHDLTARCIRDRTILPMVQHAERIATQRFEAGFGLAEVQAGFGAYEEVLWRWIAAELEPADFPEAFGLVGTVLGAGKETAAVEYVSLASNTRVGSLDLSRLFEGG